MTPQERLPLHFNTLSRAVDFTKIADAKAAPLLAGHTAIVGVIATRAVALADIVRDSNAESFAVCAVALCYIVLTLISAILAGRVFIPISPKIKKSLIYFEEISSYEYEKFRIASQELDWNKAESELLDQIYRVSRVASKKMFRVRWAYYTAGPATVLWATLLVWSSL